VTCRGQALAGRDPGAGTDVRLAFSGRPRLAIQVAVAGPLTPKHLMHDEPRFSAKVAVGHAIALIRKRTTRRSEARYDERYRTLDRSAREETIRTRREANQRLHAIETARARGGWRTLRARRDR
jgi:hypothetical protein